MPGMCLLVSALSSGTVAVAQSQSASAPPSPAPKRHFCNPVIYGQNGDGLPLPSVLYSVVSIKPHTPKPGSPPYPRYINELPDKGSGPAPDSYRYVNVGVLRLIDDSCHIQYSGLVSVPLDWTAYERYNIDLKMDEAAASKFMALSPEQQDIQRRYMLQAFLIDHFQLKVHYLPSKDGRPVYLLKVADGGIKFKKAARGEPERAKIGFGLISVRNMPLRYMFDILAHETDLTVVDKTGLDDNYDFTLTWTPTTKRLKDGSGISLNDALEEQLGLQLVPARAVTYEDRITIDHIERPSLN